MLAIATGITVIDFETTGVVRGYENEPWQIGMVLLEGGKVSSAKTFDSLLCIKDRPFNRHTPGRHEELRPELQRAPLLQTLWPQLKPWLAAMPVAAYNIGTEKNVLDGAFPFHEISQWIDILKVVRCIFPDAKSHALEDIVVRLDLSEYVKSLCPGRKPHDAMYDATMAAAVLERVLSHARLSACTLDMLVNAHPKRFYDLMRTRSNSAIDS
ncbi:MAG: hypothetical protein GF398_06460 [Chitinivibrionales bacterium]|nr:hypothetical protein [Chitinivibrionales bacterium]